MLEGLDRIDWTHYPGWRTPVEVRLLMHKLISDDYYIRQRACSDLGSEIEDAYEYDSEMPVLLIPFLIELLMYPNLPDKLLITDILLTMTSFAEYPNIPEPYKSKAEKMKQAVCNAVKAKFAQITSQVYTSSEQEDIVYLLTACGCG